MVALKFDPQPYNTDPIFGQDLLPAQTVLAALPNSRSANPAQILDRYQTGPRDAVELASANLIQILGQYKRIFVGVSGGLDSIVLAHTVLQVVPECILVHVHHHLQAEADQWLQFVSDFASAHTCSLQIFHVDIKPKPAESIEAFARHARYDFFSSLLTEPTDALLLAHHQDDQVETFFLNLARGSGLNGLTGMPAARSLGRGQLLRPLLKYSRVELEAYARHHHLNWVSDPSNQDQRFDRNFLRATVLPLFKSRWPHFYDKIQDAMGYLQEVRLLTEVCLEEKLADMHEGPAGLSLKKIRILSYAEQKLLLQLWFKRVTSLNLTTVHLERVIQDFLLTDNDAAPLFQFHGWALRRNRQQLYLERKTP